MAIEVEKKYRISRDRMLSVTEQMENAGAEFAGEDVEENIIYSGAVLQEKGAVLRIRTIGERALLTFKVRLPGDGDIKRQHEEETEVADAAALKAIIEELGFRPVIVYEKVRATWKFRDVEIVMDQLPFGTYMEIEGSITSIREAEILLDLEDLETEHQTYPMLAAEFGERLGDTIEARFPARP